MKFVVLLLLTTFTVAVKINYFAVLDKVCEKYIHYEPMCYFYDFSNGCYPWNLADCNILYYSAHEANCITYICSVSLNKMLKQSL